jgi:hypothetical protein
VRKGLPTVIVVSEQFERLSKHIMKSRNVPDRIAILVRGNPEFISDEKLELLAEQVLTEAVARITRQ